MKKVVIDPGHGGSDPGAIGPSGLQEKDVAFAVALRLAGVLQELPGVEVEMTRVNDAYLSPNERAQLANKQNAAIFVSIHCNSAASPAAHGAEVWTSVGDTDADQLAEWITEAIKKDLPELVLRADMTDGDMDKENDFTVLKLTRMPAVLVEMAFISNPTEEGYLEDVKFHVRMTRAIADGIAAYLGLQFPAKWDPVAEIQKLMNDGLLVQERKPAATVTWGELATVLNRMGGGK